MALSGHRRSPASLTPATIALIYAAIAVAWILFSDHFVRMFVADPERAVRYQTAKGLAFVLLTALLLFLLVRRLAGVVRRSERGLAGVVDAMVEAVLVVGADGSIAVANRAAEELIGRSASDARGLSLATLAPGLRPRRTDGSPMPPEEDPLAAALRGETVPGRELVIRRAGGAEAYVGVSASPVRRGGQVALAVVVMRDITELRRLARLRDEFLATAAHELKTPIATIKGYAQLLRRWGGHDSRETAAFAVVDRQCERIGRLVQDLLVVSRLPSVGLVLRREPFDLGELVTEVVARVEEVTPRHKVRVGRVEPARVDADRLRIEQVVVNLLDNAVRFSPAGGDVDVTVTAQDGEVVTSIADRGIGIPADRQARIFERFYKAHTGTAHDYGGIGVGLYLNREVIDRHGGRMWFESEEGKGSTFHFSLPLEERVDGA